MSKPGTIVGEFRVVKRIKELFKGYPFYVAIDLPRHEHAWYLLADGTISHECNSHTMKRSKNSGWFATMEDVEAAIKLYEAKKGVKQHATRI